MVGVAYKKKVEVRVTIKRPSNVVRARSQLALYEKRDVAQVTCHYTPENEVTVADWDEHRVARLRPGLQTCTYGQRVAGIGQRLLGTNRVPSVCEYKYKERDLKNVPQYPSTRQPYRPGRVRRRTRRCSLPAPWSSC